MASASERKIKQYKRKLLRDLLAQRTPNQRAKFNAMYISVEKINETDIYRAYEQVEGTIRKNLEAVD